MQDFLRKKQEVIGFEADVHRFRDRCSWVTKQEVEGSSTNAQRRARLQKRFNVHLLARCCIALPQDTSFCTRIEPAQEPEKKERRKFLIKRLLATVGYRVWEQEVAGSNPVAPIKKTGEMPLGVFL